MDLMIGFDVVKGVLKVRLFSQNSLCTLIRTIVYYMFEPCLFGIFKLKGMFHYFSGIYGNKLHFQIEII